MYETNLGELNLRLLNFLRDFDEKEVSFEDVRKFFTFPELMHIMQHSNLQENLVQMLLKMDLPEDFQEFVDLEAQNCLDEDWTDLYFLNLASDEMLLEKIKKLDKYENDLIIRFLKTDESRIKALSFRSVKTDNDKSYRAISNFTDDNLKIKYMHLLHDSYLSDLMATIKDEKLQRLVIEKYPQHCGALVSKFKDENMRIYYYEKYFRKLKSNEKAKIFKTLSEENQKKYLERYWKKLSDEEKISHLATLKNVDLLVEKANLLSPEYEKIKLISSLGYYQTEKIKRIEETLTYKNSSRLVRKIIKNNNENVFFHLDAEKIFPTTSDARKIKLIDFLNSETRLKMLATMKKFRNIEKNINHIDDFPKYDDSYKPLLERYAKQYNLNPEHLIKIVELVGLEILKNIRKENVQALINLDEENFNKVMGLFDVEKHRMDINTLNDNINILLQRQFKLQNPEIINISSEIRLNIQNGNTDEALKLIDKIVSEYDITEILKKHNYTSEEFLQDLLHNSNHNERVNNCLLAITNGYIVHKRNEYNQNNIERLQKLFSTTKKDPKSIINFMIQNCPPSMIKQQFFHTEEITLENGYTKEEVALANNHELVDQIIKARREGLKDIPIDVKKSMGLFNRIIEKELKLQMYSFHTYLPRDLIKTISVMSTYVDESIIRDALLELDVELLKNGILKDSVSYDALNTVLTKYKLFGFNEQMRDDFSQSDLWINGTTISSLIKYFPVIYADLQSKIEKGEIKNITLSSMLDMADCYGMESNKLAILFGKDNIRYLVGNPGPNSAPMSKEKRLEKAQNFLSTMYERKYVSVPPCDQDFELSNGKKMNVVIGNVTDPINLTYGERTKACMRIGGHADELFSFCLKDDHGFHIRFSNPEDGNFVSRVSCFRNGNTVFLNELRFSTDSRYTNEDVREACEMAARFLIEQSKDSPNPIQNVVIAPDHVYSGEKTTPLGVPNVKKGLGNFYSDVNSDNAVVIATSNPDNSLVPVKLGIAGMKKYPVQRGKIRKYDSERAIEQMYRIEMLDQILSGKTIDETTTRPKKDIAFCYCGEDWYVMVDTKGNISEYVMESTNKRELANREKKDCIRQIKQQLGYKQETTFDNEHSKGGTKR